MNLALFDRDDYRAAGELVHLQSPKDDSTLARIAELLCEVELLRRGHLVSRPSVDTNGIDLLVGSLRVQVKSTRAPFAPGWPRQQPRYRFQSGGSTRFENRVRQADVFVFFAHDSAAFWVIPAGAISVKGECLTLTRELDDAWRDAWHVFGEGVVSPGTSLLGDSPIA